MAAKLQEPAEQTFYVANKAGATETIGAAVVVQAPADGYTLMANYTTYSLLPHIFRKLPFDYDRNPLPGAAFVFAPMAVVVPEGSAYKTLADLLGAAKAKKNKVTYGTGGAGTTPYFATEALGVDDDTHRVRSFCIVSLNPPSGLVQHLPSDRLSAHVRHVRRADVGQL